MVRGFVVEIQLEEGIRYLNKRSGGRNLSRVPVFFLSHRAVRSLLSSDSFYRNGGYHRKTMAAATTVIVVDMLDKGMVGAVAKRFALAEFEAMVFDSKSQVKRDPNAIYKIELAAKHPKTGRPQYVGERKTKYGRVWAKPGHVRSYISSHLKSWHNAMREGGELRSAQVVEIIVDIDGITPLKVNRIPLVDFLIESPYSAAAWSTFTRGSASLKVINTNPQRTSDRSPYA